MAEQRAPRGSLLERRIRSLLRAERGHFRYESGDHGDLWLDLDRLFLNPPKIRSAADELARLALRCEPEVVAGPLTGGAFLALLMAEEIGARFVPAERSRGPAGRPVYRIPIALRDAVEGCRILVVDDAINAGSAVRSTLENLATVAAAPVGLASLATLGDAASRIADDLGVPLFRLMAIERSIWPAEGCPLCKAGVPLIDRTPD